MADVLERRRRERGLLLERARSYADALSSRLPVRVAVVAGSVARGDFNVWSDVDVLVVMDELPARAPERMGLLLADAPARIQPVGLTPSELRTAYRKGNRLVREAVERGVPLIGGKDGLQALITTEA